MTDLPGTPRSGTDARLLPYSNALRHLTGVLDINGDGDDEVWSVQYCGPRHPYTWEIRGYELATLGFPTVSIARPLDNPYVSDFVVGVRERTGQQISAKKGATEEVGQLVDSPGTGIGVINGSESMIRSNVYARTPSTTIASRNVSSPSAERALSAAISSESFRRCVT